MAIKYNFSYYEDYALFHKMFETTQNNRMTSNLFRS